MYSTQLCKAVAQVPDAPLNGHINAKYFALFQGIPVNHSHVDWSHLPLGEGQGDTDVGIKGAGAGTTRGADDGRAELALEEALDEAIVVLHVTCQCLCRHLLVRTTCSILCEGEEEERRRERGRRERGKRKGRRKEEGRGNECSVLCQDTDNTTMESGYVISTDDRVMPYTPRQHKYTNTP